MREIEKNEESNLFFIILGFLAFILTFCMTMYLYLIGKFLTGFCCELLMIILFYCTCVNIEDYKKKK